MSDSRRVVESHDDRQQARLAELTCILVADDSETILLLIRTRLEMEGYEVDTASDGQEVAGAASTRPPTTSRT